MSSGPSTVSGVIINPQVTSVTIYFDEPKQFDFVSFTIYQNETVSKITHYYSHLDHLIP